MPSGRAPSDASNRGFRALVLEPVRETGEREVLVWSLTPRVRLERALARAGATQVDVLAPDAAPPDAADERWVVARADHLFDERLVTALCAAADVALATDSEPPELVAASVDRASLADAVAALRAGAASAPAGLRRVAPEELAPAYNPALRKFDPPFIFPARREDVRRAENRIYSAAYKGITDLVTKWVFPLPARAVVRFLARRAVTPNAVTFWSYVLAVLVTVLFATGWFAAGLVAGWVMTFLDTVDGKLARVTLTSSRLGGALDHGLDLVHPPIWWAAWAWGLAGAAGFDDGFGPYALAAWIVVGGYFAGRVLEGIFLAAFKQEIFCWRPFDAAFRTVIARRNPNLILLSAGVLYGRPDRGYEAVAVWTLVCLAVATVRIVQAAALRQRGGTIRPFAEERAEAST